MKRVILSFLAALCVTVRISGAENALHAGEWELATIFEMSGLPMAPPPKTVTRCVTAADARDPRGIIRDSQSRGSDCVVDDYGVAGHRVTWTMTCTGKYHGSGSGEIILGGDRYEGTFILKIQDGRGAGHAVTYRMRGNRIGACPR